MALLSVIVPIYNKEKYLRRSIKSLIGQTLEDIEIILVNDGSTDKSLSICKKYAEEDSRITIINQENYGVSKARNIGIQCAKSEYIAFMDADDDIDVNMYETLYSDITKSNADLVLCNYKDVKGKNEIDLMLPYDSGIYEKEDAIELLLEMIGPQYFSKTMILGSACRGIYKKSILVENDIFFPTNISFMEDLIFNINYLLNIKNFYINSLCLYYYYENPNSAVTAYKPDIEIKENQVFNTIVNILKANNLYNNSLSRLATRRTRMIMNIIRNEMKRENSISYFEKLKNIKNLLNNPINTDYLMYLNTKDSNIKEKIIGYLFRKKRARLIYMAIKVQMYFK